MLVKRKTTMRATPLGRVRRADLNDVHAIMKIKNESMSMTFRCQTTADVTALIKYAVLCICQLDITKRVVGFVAVKDYPLVPSIHPKAWEEFLWTRYKAIELRSRNTLFLHLMCWEPIYAREAVDGMLKTIFMHDTYLNFIAMVKPLPQYPLLVPGQSRAEASFKRVMAMERGVPGDRLPVLYIAERKDVCPRLRIRRAVEEDNDDIVPIMEKHSTRLREMYGEFYISELISRHPESERVLLVCEHNELAVGVMCLNTQINYTTLEENYQLSVFSGLRKIDTTPKHNMESTVSLFDFNHGSANSAYQILEHGRTEKTRLSRVSWLEPDDNITRSVSTTENGTDLENLEDSMTYMLSNFPNHDIDFLQLLEDEQDEVDFEIINIDTELLRVPQLLSYDDLARIATSSLAKLLTVRDKESFAEETIMTKDKVRKITAASRTGSYVMSEPIRYSGPPNAFLLELFAMHQDYDERYGFDMLEAAFELFPQRDYCVISLPTDHIAFPLLEHFTSATPCTWKMKYVNKTLYVAHVNSIRGKLSVRLGEANDLHKVMDILEHTPRRKAITDLFTSSLTSHTMNSFVLLSENQPVGIMIIGPLKDGISIRNHYVLEPYERRADGAVIAGVVSPVFEPHSRWYYREIIRQTELTSLFWICRLVARGEGHPRHNLMSLACCMVPARPRNTVANISKNRILEQMTKNLSTPFSVWYIERPLTSLPKVEINSSIVVVGASSTCLAFLEGLLMGISSTYLNITNITLVSERGLPTVVECLRAADICVPHSGRFTDRYMKTIPLYFYIDVLVGIMTKIDREKKCIYLKGGAIKFYDELILLCGTQFQQPEYLERSLEIEKELEKGKPCERILMDNPKYLPDQVPLLPHLPDNVMLINSIIDSNHCLRRLMRMISDTQRTPSLSQDTRVVVYGEWLEAYSCMAALLEIGLSGDKITFIEPFPPEDSAFMRVNCFNNETVDERVQLNIENLGIRILRKCYFLNWQLDSDDRISHIRLMSNYHIICIPCFALFYFGLKAIDIYSFKAINECGLVYDGGLVIGNEFDTNDPHIFAAGTCTKYSRRLYADRFVHKYYNSEEIGETLAKIFLRKLDPFLIARNKNVMPDILPTYSSSILLEDPDPLEEKSFEPPRRKWRPVMRFKSPILVWATLPGPLHYLKLTSAGAENPMEVALTMPRQGHTLLTDFKGNYFRLQLNVLHCIESVTCLSKDPIHPEILSQLHGKHESYFNSLLKRFELKMIDDLYEYFVQPWMAAMYNDTFEDLIHGIINQNLGTVYDLARSKFTFSDQKEKSRLFPRGSGNIPECGFGPMDADNLGTFRNILESFVLKPSCLLSDMDKVVDVPSECGQSESVRSEVSSFWQAVGGQRICLAHIGRYLTKYYVANPHYGKIKQ